MIDTSGGFGGKTTNLHAWRDDDGDTYKDALSCGGGCGLLKTKKDVMMILSGVVEMMLKDPTYYILVKEQMVSLLQEVVLMFLELMVGLGTPYRCKHRYRRND